MAGIWDMALKAGGSLMKSTALKNAAIGAGVGAVGGAMNAQEGQRMSGALKGGLLGGAVGGAVGIGRGVSKAMANPNVGFKEAVRGEFQRIGVAGQNAAKAFGAPVKTSAPVKVVLPFPKDTGSTPPLSDFARNGHIQRPLVAPANPTAETVQKPGVFSRIGNWISGSSSNSQPLQAVAPLRGVRSLLR